MNLSGKFIVIDGPDGSGKGTQLERLSAWINANGGKCVRTRDPGGSVIGDRIRHILLDYDLSDMAHRCETFLFMASRAQLVHEIVRPAIERGETVLCDRFISATCAYQGALGVPSDEIIAIGRHAVGDTWPDLTIVLDVPPEVGFERTGRKPHHVGRKEDIGQISMFDGATTDAMERRPLEFHRKVRQIFQDLPAAYPQPVAVLDAQADPDAVWQNLQKAVQDAFS